MPAAAIFPVFRWGIMANGVIVPGAKLYTWLSGTNTPYPVYTDTALIVPHANPVVADASGVLPVMYTANLAYRVLVTDALGATVFAQTDGIYNFAQMQVLIAANIGMTAVGAVIGPDVQSAIAQLTGLFATVDPLALDPTAVDLQKVTTTLLVVSVLALAGAATFQDIARDVSTSKSLEGVASSDVSGTIILAQASTLAGTYHDLYSIAVTGGTPLPYSKRSLLPFVKARYVNGAGAQATFFFSLSASVLPPA